MTITEGTNVNDLLAEAKRLLGDVPAGTEFMVKDLFRGYEWAQIPIRQRIRLGALFLAFAEGEGFDLVRISEKSKQNQQKYLRK